MALGKLKKVEIEATPNVQEELRNVLIPTPCEGVPSVTGYYDRAGRLRRIACQYENGWRAQINIDAAGYVTSKSARLKLTMEAGDA